MRTLLATLATISLLAVPVLAHDEAVAVGDYYVVVNEDDGCVGLWQESNGLEDFQRHPSAGDDGELGTEDDIPADTEIQDECAL